MTAILGLNAYHGDAAAALVVDGELVAAAEEERFNRVKHCAGFPALAARWCLEAAGLAPADLDHVAIGRVELLYPFAENELRELMQSYPSLKTVVWAQEEPKNMGARHVMEQRLSWIMPEGVGYEYIGRQLRASPGEGYAAAHRTEQARIVREALGVRE